MPIAFSHRDRAPLLQRLTTEFFDLLIVGGGITGAGIARDAAMRGLRVALVEKGDFASGTSSKSSKLVHVGLRYLEQKRLHLVFEGTRERARLSRQAPHLVRPLPFLFPIYQGASHAPWLVDLGMWLYDILALFGNYRRHRKLLPAATRTLEPGVNERELRASMLYYDCITDDARLTLETIQSAYAHGAVPLSYCAFEGAIKGPHGRVCGAQVRDKISGRAVELQTRVLVLAAGAWTDRVRQQGDSSPPAMIRPTKGVHIVVPKRTLPVHHAVVMSALEDKRVVFAIPWEESTLIGTTDTDFDGDPNQVRAQRSDIDYLLKTIAHFFPGSSVHADDVQGTWAGLRPLVDDGSDSPYDSSREHTILSDPSGVVTIAGGKLTTYRKMASECVAQALKLLPAERRKGRKRCPTKKALLPGAEHFNYVTDHAKAVAELVGAPLELSPPNALRIVQTYGGQYKELLSLGRERPDAWQPFTPEHPVLRVELDYALAHEMVLDLEDFLVRRTHLHYHLADQGRAIAPAIAEQMAAALGWDDAERERQLTRYLALVALSQAWKDDPPAG